MANPKLLEMIRNKKQAIDAQSSRREKTVKPQNGKNRFRILPPWRGGDDTQFWHDFGQHYIKSLDKKLLAVYVCTEKTFGKPCSICAAIGEGIENAEDDRMIETLKGAQARGRYLVNALHLDGEDPTTPVILELGVVTFKQILDLMEEYPDLYDLENGNDLIINRSGKGIDTKYNVVIAAKSSPVSKAILKKLHNLDDYVAQEYEEGRVKALAAVKQVAGLLPAPEVPSADRPMTKPPIEPEPLDVEYEEVKASKGPGAEVTAGVAATATAAVAATSEEELDALLEDLN